MIAPQIWHSCAKLHPAGQVSPVVELEADGLAAIIGSTTAALAPALAVSCSFTFASALGRSSTFACWPPGEV